MVQKRPKKAKAPPVTEIYEHPDATVALRPDAGTQAQFKKQKPAQRYRYDSSLAPALEWDGQNAARELGEALIAEILHLAAGDSPAAGIASGDSRAAVIAPGDSRAAVIAPGDSPGAKLEKLERIRAAALQLKALGKPFLDWAGKAERLSFDVPTLPLFVHERLSTEAIIRTLRGHRKPGEVQGSLFDLFADPQRSIADQVLKAYEYRDQWTNRMVLGDSLVVMNSLLHFENLGGQVQMIYMDPPYGIKYGSNFQPFVRRRDVKHNDDHDLTREPEMVQAYRDTWEIGLHSYLTCMRDRLLLCRELLAPSGSVFVQIGEENAHFVRVLLDEVFGSENAVATIVYKSAVGLGSETLDTVATYVLFYGKDRGHLKFRHLYRPLTIGEEGATRYLLAEGRDGTIRRLTPEEQDDPSLVPSGWRPFFKQGLTSRSGSEATQFEVNFEGKKYKPTAGGWRTGRSGMQKLIEANRIAIEGNRLTYKRYFDDFRATPINNIWADISGGIKSRSDPKVYVVQTSTAVIERCLLMTTDPGDLVLDPTCGSGTTAYVAEQWGRRWITADVSRVPLALARQRLLTATFSWYDLKDEERGPAGGFVYKRKQNKKGEEVGGIVPHVTLKSIANNEPPAEEVLVDRPETNNRITRVTGPFAFEAMIPTAADLNELAPGESPGAGADRGTTGAPVPTGATGAPGDSPGGTPGDSPGANSRMLEVLRRSPVLRLDGNRTITLHNIRPPAKSLSLSAEALVDLAPGESPGAKCAVAFVFGPENAAVSEKLVKQAAFEARAKSFTHLYVIGFAIQPHARQLVDQCEAVMDIPATYVQATPDLLMGDLLKNMRSSQIFSVCGLPEVEVRQLAPGESPGAKYEVELLGLDVFDPTTMETQHRNGDDVPAWFLDTDYNDLCFHVCQAFFPRTSAWDNLKKALKGDYSESVWDHLAGTISAPFEAGENQQIAVKVIDDRGNELVVVKRLGK